MRDITIVVTATGLTVALALAGCSREPERAQRDAAKTTPSVSETERAGSSQPSDINPMTARLRVSDLRVGTVLSADGRVADNENLLHAGDTLQASIAVGDVAAGSAIKALWLGPDGQRIADEVKKVEAGAAFLVFRAPSTSTWAVGEHKVEIYLGDELAASDSFDIVASTPPA